MAKEPRLDIKDFILIGGGILIALVVGHGFWIAWRAKREPLRMDIVPDLIPTDDIDDMERLRGELPNGGARVVRRKEVPDQQSLELESAPPVLVEPALPEQDQDTDADATRSAGAPSEQDAIPPPRRAPFDRPKKLRAPIHPAEAAAPASEPAIAANQGGQPELSLEQPDLPTSTRPRVLEVDLHAEPIVGEASGTEEMLTTPGIHTEKRRDSSKLRSERKRQGSTQSPAQPETAPVEELLIINVLARKGQRFEGEDLVAALRSQGLRYGDMNIFHRVEPTTKAKLYSVANAVEPGTFDLSDLSTMRSPGMTFFLQLPGPDDAGAVFEDMLQAARKVALDLGGELRDEDLSVLTGQTMEHMRQRIADFARRRLSKRA